MTDYYIGIDGGGTKTRLRLEDVAGKVLAEQLGGPSNINTHPELAWNNINQTLQDALASARIKLDGDTRLFVGAGLAGCELTNARATFISMVPKFYRFELASDSYIACLGAHAGANGAIAIIGTGAVGLKIVDKKITQVSGLGFPHDDQGSGAWLGWQAMRATLQLCDGRQEKSALLEHLRNTYGPDISTLLTWMYAAKPTQYALLTPIIADYAQGGDDYATQLLQHAGHCIAHLISALKLQESKLSCALIGGAVRFVAPYLPEYIKELLVPAKFDSCWGALSLVRNR